MTQTTEKQNRKIETMKAEGWEVERVTEAGMNQKYFPVVIMTKEGKKKYVNYRGGHGGLTIVICQTNGL